MHTKPLLELINKNIAQNSYLCLKSLVPLEFGQNPSYSSFYLYSVNISTTFMNASTLSHCSPMHIEFCITTVFKNEIYKVSHLSITVII